MYNNKRISVAMASYNGAKYIREQIESILDQTVIPDEIIISDDGSTDQTMQILQEFANLHPYIIKIYSDNPRHGFAYNFSHAISHCSGDIIFLCDQDDIWDSKKVEHIVDVYRKYPDALCVFHNALSVDSKGKPNNVPFNSFVESLAMENPVGAVVKVPGYPNCEIASNLPMHGMIMSVSKELLNTAYPFPPISSQHDGWLWFCSEALDACYYLNEILTYRRIHTNNTSGVGKQGFGIQRMKKIVHNITKQNESARTRIVQSQYMEAFIFANCTKDNVGAMSALPTISRISEIGRHELDAASSGRLSGSIKLIKLYLKDVRYRKSGTKSFLYELAEILLRSKKNRLENLNGIMPK